MLKDRGEKFNIEDLNKCAREIKEKYGYIAKDGLFEEFLKFDKKKEIGPG